MTFDRGDQVVERGSHGVVGHVQAGPEEHGGERYYRVEFNGQVRNLIEEDLERFVGKQDLKGSLAAGKFGDHRAFARWLTMSKLRRPLRDAIYSYKASRTDFYPYQFTPLLKFLASDRRRLLIADEVGLGKTIEAGYILQEEKARYPVQRVLVVCPASLRTKWQNELWQRFGEEFEVLDRARFLSKAALRPEQEARGLPRLQGIVSLQSLRSDATVDAIETRGAPIDLLIIDEAHHCRNRDTKQHRAARALQLVSEATILLTATPVHLGDENLFNLLSLLVPEEFDNYPAFQERLRVNRHIVEAERVLRYGGEDAKEQSLRCLREVEATVEGPRFLTNPLYRETVETLSSAERPLERAELVAVQENLSRINLLAPVMSRTRKRDVYPDAARREAHVRAVEMSDHEQEVYDQLSDFCLRLYTIWHGDFAARFALITLQRQMASSMHATLDHYRRLLSAQREPAEDDDALEQMDDDTADAPAEPPTFAGGWLIETDGFAELVAECSKLLRGASDSKLAELKTVLAHGDKVVLFSYFKRSLRYLEQSLREAGIGCVRIDGDVKSNPMLPEQDERLKRIAAFRDDPAIQVLLSSEVGSEGLDFQFCHVVINWDLPWNPMVVEQRIGRLDRLGQRSEKILVFSFSTEGTIEDIILQRLYMRIGVFEQTIGALEPILGREIRELTDQLLDARLTRAQREELVDRRAVALARCARDEARLETEAPSLVGHDEFFADHLERVRKLGRFVTGDELRLFVSSFLSSDFPTCSLLPLTNGGGRDPEEAFELKISRPLLDFVKRPLARNDPALLRFVDRSTQGHVAVTFHNHRAVEQPVLELINSQHPLVRAIAHHYDEQRAEMHPAVALRVQSDAVPPADYFFLWASIEERSIRGGRSLWAVALPVDGDEVPDAEAAETLLHHMIVRGERWGDFLAPDAAFSADMLCRTEAVLVDRFTAYRSTSRGRNDAMIESRLASLDASYRVKEREKKQRIETLLERGTPEARRMIPAFEGQLSKFEADYDEQKRQVEEKRRFSASWDPEGGGYVQVVAKEAGAEGA